MKINYIRLSFKLIALSVFIYCSYLLILLTLPYLSFETDVGFLRIKQRYIDVHLWLGAFYVHVFTSCFVLPAGLTQFSRNIIQKRPTIHRKIGYLYIITILFLSAPSGFIMAFYANGGWLSKAAFLMLSILWVFTTYQAYATARNKNWDAHGRYMFRSFALTLSAITLRIWKPTLYLLFEPNPMDLYRLVAWLGWLPNLLFAELLIYKKQHLKLLSNR